MGYKSTTEGTITLIGAWDETAVNIFLPVLAAWSFYNYTGILYHKPLSVQEKTAYFEGAGNGTFNGTLDAFDSWTRDWIKLKQWQKDARCNPLTTQQYKALIAIMQEQELSLQFEFDDIFEDGYQVHQVGILKSDGKRLNYELIASEDTTPPEVLQYYEEEEEENEEYEEDEDCFWEGISDEELAKLYKWSVNYQDGTISYSMGEFSSAVLFIGYSPSLRERYNWLPTIPHDFYYWQNTKQIAVGRDIIAHLKSNGEVDFASINEQATRQTGWQNIQAVAAGWEHILGLTSNGRVLVHSQEDVPENTAPLFADWQDIVAIAAGAYHSVGLKKDGTVLAVGNNDYEQCNVAHWRDIIAIAASGGHTIGLKSDGRVVIQTTADLFQDINNWQDIIAIDCGEMFIIGLKKDGTVVAVGDNAHGQCDIGHWQDITAITAGGWHSLGLKADKTLIATGGNEFGSCEVNDWTDIKHIAAGFAFSFGIKEDGSSLMAGQHFNPLDSEEEDDEDDWYEDNEG